MIYSNIYVIFCFYISKDNKIFVEDGYWLRIMYGEWRPAYIFHVLIGSNAMLVFLIMAPLYVFRYFELTSLCYGIGFGFSYGHHLCVQFQMP